ncbi:MAG TPA: hypothetical protein VKN99_01440 [Polyangia bacterium]|nr:hypothetical protein [Polyangia bacterium]
MSVAIGCGDNGGGTGGRGGTGGSGGTAGTGGTGGRDSGPDAPMPDAMNPDAATASCEPSAIVELTIASGMNSATHMGTTMGAPMGLEPMTQGCTGPMTGPEVVHHLRVPGTGTIRIDATTDDAATTADTVLYVQTQCGGGNELACNDDAANATTMFTSTVRFNTTGGTDLYLVVDTYMNASNAGPYKLTVKARPEKSMGQSCDPAGMTDVCVVPLACLGTTPTCQVDPSAPVLTKAESFWADSTMSTMFLYLTGTDTEGNTNGVTVVFKDASGASLGGGSATLNGLMGMMSFTAYPVRGDGTGAASLDVYLTDATMKQSNTVNSPIRTEKALNMSCDPMLNAPDECFAELVCTNMSCAVAAGTNTACTAATTIQLGAANAVTGSITNTTADQFRGSCFYFPGGGEKAYKVTLPAVPAGTLKWDLIATTIDTPAFDPMTMLDTYVYVRTTCNDPSATSEKGCNDDDPNAASGDLRSTATAQNLDPGMYFVFVDAAVQPTASRSYKLTVTSRNVLASGQTCDPMGVMNRCQMGVCPTTGAATCP